MQAMADTLDFEPVLAHRAQVDAVLDLLDQDPSPTMIAAARALLDQIALFNAGVIARLREVGADDAGTRSAVATLVASLTGADDLALALLELSSPPDVDRRAAS